MKGDFKVRRSSGVLMHISTLFGDYSIGSFGENAKKFIDFLCDCGFSYWQTLPFCMTDSYNSPYKSFSAFSCNPYFIDLEKLYSKGYISKEELSLAKQKAPYSCEFERLSKERILLLSKASKKAAHDDVDKFIANHPEIDNFCKFMALKAANGNKEWREWTCFEYDEAVYFTWKFMQYEFVSEWLEIKAYANRKGIKIIGDMPMFVDLDSSDVYFNRDSFLLDGKNAPIGIAGVPPDYFSADGQVWGNPHYDWDSMKKNGFKWWRERINHMFMLFDGVRIDHFRGLESFYSIPYGDKTAKNGKWVKAKGKEMLDAVSDITAGRLVIAEDLGDITEDVIKLVRYSGFPGMRVMQFGFLSEQDSTHRFHNYENNCVAYTGTHDNSTLLGYVWEMPPSERKLLFEYCGYNGDIDNCYDSIVRTLFSSAAGIVILPIQDLLLFGNDTRLNMPGRADGNWGFRITEDNLSSIDKEKYRRYNQLYGRI